LDPAILGVTVLAWGNSLMDYINNTVRFHCAALFGLQASAAAPATGLP